MLLVGHVEHLSLGADLCWPLCFEHLLRRLDLAIPWQGEEVRVAVERVTIEPFDLQQRTKYTVVLDRLTHWYYTSREWIKKSVILDDVYVLNNPWAIQSMEKHSTYAAMMRLDTNQIYMFSGRRYVRYSNVSNGIDPGYPNWVDKNWMPFPRG